MLALALASVLSLLRLVGQLAVQGQLQAAPRPELMLSLRELVSSSLIRRVYRMIGEDCDRVVVILDSCARCDGCSASRLR